MNNNFFRWIKGWEHAISLLLLLLIGACSPNLFVRPNQETASSVKAGQSGLDNAKYADRLLMDGWPVDLLNTAAEADYLDDDEKNMVLAHNLVRHDPEKFARLYVAEYYGYYQGAFFRYPGVDVTWITDEGLLPVIELFRQLLRTKPVDLIYPHPGLSGAAMDHANYLRERNARGHGGMGGVRGRMERHGRWSGVIGENISYGSFSAHDALMVLLIDDNVPDRSHRKNILLPDYQLAGIGKTNHPSFPNGYTYVINYAQFFD